MKSNNIQENNSPSLRKFSKYVVSHLIYSRAVATIELAIEATQSSGQPHSAMLTGESGTGKTTVCEYLVHKRPIRRDQVDASGIRTVVPAFYCCVSAQVTIKGLATVMLMKLGCSELTGSQVILTSRLCALIETCQTEVIFLDEFHHLLRSDASKVLGGVRDWVKDLINETGVTVVLVGLPKCEAIIDEDPETKRRFPHRASLSHFPFSTEPSSQYIKVLKALSSAMVAHAGLAVTPVLTDADKAAAFYVATGGNMNSIRLLLFQVSNAAFKVPGRRVVWEDFAVAFESITVDHCLMRHGNPFRQPMQQLHNIIANGGSK
ncbi:MAG: TniB family NTP-binding protein [Burkholderiales bacterium]|nr:TniB family NTP-binding protein [Burkholderiales bacterium]